MENTELPMSDVTKFKAIPRGKFSITDKDGDVLEILPDGSIKVLSNIGDFFFEVITGQISEYTAGQFAGNNPSMEANVLETVWTQGGRLNVLETDVQMYVSSTSAADTMVAFITGWDSDFNPVTRLVTLNGQNQIALSDTMMIVSSFTPTSEIAGDVYVAETDTLTDGKPNTDSKIQMKILADDNNGFNGVFVVPPGKTAFLYDLSGTVSKGKDAQIFLKFKVFGFGFFASSPAFNVFQVPFQFREVGGALLPEKTVVLLEAKSADPGMSVTGGAQFVLF